MHLNKCSLVGSFLLFNNVFDKLLLQFSSHTTELEKETGNYLEKN